MSAAWPNTALGEVLTPVVRECQVDPSANYPLLGVRLDGQGPFHRETVLGTQTSATRLYRVKTGDFIYSRLFAWRGAFGIIESGLNDHFVSNEFPTFTPIGHRIDPKYLNYWFRLPGVLRQVEADCSGSTPLTRNRYKEQYFSALQIPLPPLCEQRRIISRIEELQKKIHEAQAIRRTLSDEAELLYSSAISQLIAAHSCQNVRLGEILGESGLRNGKSIKSVPAEKGIRCLTLSALRGGRIDVSNSKPVPMQSDEARPYLIAKGDVFVVRGNGTKTLCGRAAIVLDEVEETIFPDLFIKVALPDDKVDPRFFVSVWNAPEMRSWIEEKAKTTSGIWKINQGHIESASIPLPPLSEQRCIFAQLDALQNKVNAVTNLQKETAAELDAMIPAILDKAFKGEL